MEHLVRQGGEPASVEIRDPIRGDDYMLDTQHKTFRQFRSTGAAAIHPPIEPPPLYTMIPFNLGEASAIDPADLAATVSLGEKVLEGVIVVGSRLERTIQPGTFQDHLPTTPIPLSEEQWFNRDLGVIVMSRRRTIVGTEETERLQQIVRSEPDPALFVIPSDYTRTTPP